jgi:hypothetical protein
MNSKTAAIEAENAFTVPHWIGSGPFNISVWGTFVATVTVQRSFDDGATFRDVASFTEATEEAGFEPEGTLYRIGVKTGDYTSGTVNVRIGQ